MAVLHPQANIFRHLARNGKQTLEELVAGCSSLSSPSRISAALATLLSHRIVDAIPGGMATLSMTSNRKGMGFDTLLYVANVSRAIQWLRHPRILLHIGDTMGKDAETIIEVLVLHAALPAAETVAAAAAKRLSEDGLGGDEKVKPGERNGDDDGGIESRLERMLVKLIDEHYIERAPTFNNIFEGIGPAELAGGTDVTGGDGRSKSGRTPATQIAEVEAAARANAMQREASERFLLPPYLEARREPKVGDKRKGHNIEVEGGGFDDFFPGDDGRTVLWRVNVDEFIRRFRHELCVKLVREKVTPDAGKLLEIFLALTRPHEQSVVQERSIPLSVQEVEDAIQMSDDLQSSDALKLLEELSADTSELISRVGEGPGGSIYCVNIRRIIDLARMKQVEAAVRERFGKEGCRIFRLLLMKRQLEQKQIAEMAMIPIRFTREILYRLLQAEYVSLQEVAKTADHAPSRTYYLWRVDVENVVDRLSKELFKTACNVKVRLQSEVAKESEILNKLNEGREDAAIGALWKTFTEEQKQRLHRIKNVAAALETALIRLDEIVLLFNDI